MTDDLKKLREEVARMMARNILKYAYPDDPESQWRLVGHIADAAISLIRSERLEEAARVADAIGNTSENYRDPDVYREACENVASAIRALKSPPSQSEPVPEERQNDSP